MLGDQKRTRLEHQHAQVGPPVQLFRSVSTEHPGTYHDYIECDAAVGRGFVPCVADEAAENVERECRILKGHRFYGVLKTVDHDFSLSDSV